MRSGANLTVFRIIFPPPNIPLAVVMTAKGLFFFCTAENVVNGEKILKKGGGGMLKREKSGYKPLNSNINIWSLYGQERC